MGPLTLSVGTLRIVGDDLEIGFNFRAPLGKDKDIFSAQVKQAVNDWQAQNRAALTLARWRVGDAFLRENAPHVAGLLDIYRHYTGEHDARPVTIGGGTHARLMPQGVNFGPSRPHEAYTGHSEHEFMTLKQFQLNLKMYTAMLVRLAGAE